MKFNEYQEMSKRTMPKKKEHLTYIVWDDMDISNYCMGLAGETGEVVDYLKKVVHHKHGFNPDVLEKELGDVLHYLTGIASMFGLRLETIATENIVKLQKRYPNGFSSERSVNRSE